MSESRAPDLFISNLIAEPPATGADGSVIHGAGAPTMPGFRASRALQPFSGNRAGAVHVLAEAPIGAPSPLAGRAGEGVLRLLNRAVRPTPDTPDPNPSPQGG